MKKANATQQMKALTSFHFEREMFQMVKSHISGDRSNPRNYIRYSQRYESIEAIYPVAAHDDDKARAVSDAFELAVNLRGMDGWHGNNVLDFNIVETLQKQFRGVTALQAYVLTFGYAFEKVTALSAAEVEAYYRAAFQAHPQQLPWGILGNVCEFDMDYSLVRSMMEQR